MPILDEVTNANEVNAEAEYNYVQSNEGNARLRNVTSQYIGFRVECDVSCFGLPLKLFTYCVRLGYRYFRRCTFLLVDPIQIMTSYSISYHVKFVYIVFLLYCKIRLLLYLDV